MEPSLFRPDPAQVGTGGNYMILCCLLELQFQLNSNKLSSLEGSVYSYTLGMGKEHAKPTDLAEFVQSECAVNLTHGGTCCSSAQSIFTVIISHIFTVPSALPEQTYLQ